MQIDAFLAQDGVFRSVEDLFAADCETMEMKMMKKRKKRKMEQQKREKEK